MSNSDLGKNLAHLADVLAEYDNLPTLTSVEWRSEPKPGVAIHVAEQPQNLPAELRDRLAWAQAFDVPVCLTFSGSYVIVAAQFELGGVSTEMSETYYRDHAEALADAVADRRTSAAWQEIQLSVAEFAALIEEIAGSYVLRQWVAVYKRHYDASRKFNARHEEASTYAENKTVEELGPKPGGGA